LEKLSRQPIAPKFFATFEVESGTRGRSVEDDSSNSTLYSHFGKTIAQIGTSFTSPKGSSEASDQHLASVILLIVFGKAHENASKFFRHLQALTLIACPNAYFKMRTANFFDLLNFFNVS
jgi:hypothetical protein